MSETQQQPEAENKKKEPVKNEPDLKIAPTELEKKIGIIRGVTTRFRQMIRSSVGIFLQPQKAPKHVQKITDFMATAELAPFEMAGKLPLLNYVTKVARTGVGAALRAVRLISHDTWINEYDPYHVFEDDDTPKKTNTNPPTTQEKPHNKADKKAA
ncbi:MAG: hypothetical protein UR28_C0023G0012 [Candidatus Peregrinibacteria bacterium GW2011_GWF2_33_10]|nr:MAG: hypothetical protein UR28_C0023G0012 [Candidatus Peregrinibacteria bacterium GW2011_GWF2_33_10]OGJ44145.1 MAG: hypothetical protein A2272_02165 [Candidatus Peregrinibacteria bacterium RIFOXYA12_FULL_33_12]OGJ45122.1 MAG: hypothetical protein A2263_05205 [Candidatus Peregrinibacteria bacterium RIFOXYA2_FULL_33_21]OGJ50791.1 MAG: hypothetical protein A2307_01975 [Candidatus Peregrinibacteria bacterium RIFOXYB2_FULL_33_20]